jgi:CRISPR/Cas system-associated endonuclease Cas1
MLDKGTPIPRGSRRVGNPFPARATVLIDPRVALVDGYGYRVGVRDNMLCVSQNGSEVLYSQATAAKTGTGLARLVVISDDGTITGRAFAWLRRNDVAVIHCNREGNSNFISGAAVSDARLYRQQIMAQPDMPNAGVGLGIVRELLTAKIAGQLDVLRMMGLDSPRIGECVTMMATARDVRSMLASEGNAAIAYWKQWERHVFVPWKSSDVKHIPSHWQRFNGRASMTKADGYTESSNRNATDFVNSMLNMAYKFAEIECAFACHAFGLHPGIGISHGKIHDNLPAMALDLVEPCRPICDSIVLSYLDCGRGHPMSDSGKPFHWTKDAAMEMTGGVCRLNKEVVYKLASTISMAVAPHAMRWAETIARSIARTAHISVVAPLDPRLSGSTALCELDPAVTPRDLIPDHVWERAEPLIPVIPPGIGRRSDPRAILAAIAAHEIYGASWPKAAVGMHVDFRTCRRRLEDWQAAGVWAAIKAEITKAGVSQSR